MASSGLKWFLVAWFSNEPQETTRTTRDNKRPLETLRDHKSVNIFIKKTGILFGFLVVPPETTRDHNYIYCGIFHALFCHTVKRYVSHGPGNCINTYNSLPLL